MEKGLNSRNSLSKVHKTLKKGHSYKSSFDETTLKCYENSLSPCISNLRDNLQHSIYRNTYNGCNPSVKSQELDNQKVKIKQVQNGLKKSCLAKGGHKYSG